MIRLILIMCLLASGLACAEVYRWTNEEGVTVYSDAPPVDTTRKQAEPVDLPELNTTPAFTLPPTKTSKAATVGDKSASPYKELKIVQPADNGAVRANGGKVSVSVSLTPGLMADSGHELQLYLDGSLIASGSKTSFSLQNVDRGEHVAHAQVRDGKQKSLIASDKISFTVLRNSIILNNNTN